MLEDIHPAQVDLILRGFLDQRETLSLGCCNKLWYERINTLQKAWDEKAEENRKREQELLSQILAGLGTLLPRPVFIEEPPQVNRTGRNHYLPFRSVEIPTSSIGTPQYNQESSTPRTRNRSSHH